MLALAVGESCMFSSFAHQLSDVTLVQCEESEPRSHDWEEGLVIHTMAGMPASWFPISKQQVLFAALRQRAAW